MQHYTLTVQIRVSEVEHTMQRLLSVEDNQTVEEAIHDYLQDFWGEETVTEEKGEHYHREWQESLKIESTKKISRAEYEVMKNHIMEW